MEWSLPLPDNPERNPSCSSTKLPFSVSVSDTHPALTFYPSSNHHHPHDHSGFMMMDSKRPVCVETTVASSEMEAKEIADMEACGLHRETEAKRKRRISADQLETLERSFQEEAKLKPARKVSLARELNLEPRQVAVWFQNRRARLKSRNLETMYDELRQQFNVLYLEKQKLQQEVHILQALLRRQACCNQQHASNQFEESVNNTSATGALPADFYPVDEARDRFQTLQGLPCTLGTPAWGAQLPPDR